MKQNKGNRLLTNMMSYALLQIVNVFIGLYLPRFYLAAYGSEINGVISTANSFITYFSYLEAGIGLTLIHSLFKPLADNDTPKLNGILAFSKKQYEKISGIYFILVTALSLMFPLLNETNDMDRIELISLVFVIGMFGSLDFYSMAKYRVLLTADRKEYVISNAMILAQSLRFILTWILLNFDLSVVILKVVPIFTLFVRTVILRLYIKKRYPQADYTVQPKMDVSAVGERWDAMLLQISISSAVSLPTIIISKMFGFVEVNIFSVYIMVVTTVIGLISALSSGVAPMLGRSIAKGKDIINTYNVYDYVVTFIITLVFSVVSVLILPFVELYTNVTEGVNYINSAYALLIPLWGAFYSARIPATAVINAGGIYRQNRLSNIVNILIQLVGGIVAAILFGINGVIVVMIVSSLHRNIFLTAVNSKELLKTGVCKTVIRHAVMAVIILCSNYVFVPMIEGIEFDVYTWCLAGIVAMIVGFLICCLIFVAVDIKTSKKIFDMLKFRIKRQQSNINKEK